jgi:hypothetical protein
MNKPTVSGLRINCKATVAHAQHGVSTLLHVLVWPAPVLGEEECEPMTSVCSIGAIGIHGHQDGVGLHAIVKGVD